MSEKPMRRATRLAALLCFLSAVGFAASWSGTLVDAKCYDARERNVNPTDVDLRRSRHECGNPLLLPERKNAVFRSCAIKRAELQTGPCGKCKSCRTCSENR